MWFDTPSILKYIGNNYGGIRPRLWSKCCVQELDLVSVPSPVGVELVESLVSTTTEYEGWVMQSEQTEEIVTFVDESCVKIGTGASNHVFSSKDKTLDTDLANFLQRPVRINTVSWLESDTISIKQSINPWHLWANTDTVKNKLNNYAFIRGDLHLKFVLSASPFYYGRLRVAYQPLGNFTPSTITTDAGTRWLIPTSQRPHVDLDPQKQESVELILPFIWYKNWVNIQVASDFTDLGLLQYVIYSTLESANGVTGTGVTIATYAWMDNVQLSGATAGYSMQSDEYGDGCVSRPASQVASAATYFEKIPIIGPFATATKIGASAVSLIAKLFGYTNVPVIEDTRPVRSEPFPKLASTEIGYPIEKLTLDSKNELSIDPRIMGLSSPVDEMSIQYIASRESYLTTASWLTSDAADAILFYSRINPRIYDSDGATEAKVYMLPMGWVANLFNNWRGDIIFKFVVVCSKYHKGRLRISYDPTGYNARNIGTETNTANVVHTAIIDIGETKEVEFRVPYQQATQFLATRSSYAHTDEGWAVRTAVPATYPYDPFYDNGLITLRVLNVLTAPVASSSVDVLIFARAAENMELANPTNVDVLNRASYFVAQSSEESAPLNITLGENSLAADNQYKVHFGENVRSLRQLLRRGEYHSTQLYSIGSSASSQVKFLYKQMQRYPPCFGYDPTGQESAVKLTTGSGSAPINFCKFTYLNYVLPAFIGYRGSVNWTFNLVTPDNVCNEMRIYRDNISGSNSSYGVNNYATNQVSETAHQMMVARNSGACGQAITNCLTNSGLNVQIPSYTPFKFQTTNPRHGTTCSIVDGSIRDQAALQCMMKTNSNAAAYQVLLNNYVSAGTDFTVMFFLNVPTIFYYSATPSPVIV